ncbi:hypothetical protein ACXR2U_23325 [Jatrophihabitans sp. YIM 134969]
MNARERGLRTVVAGLSAAVAALVPPDRDGWRRVVRVVLDHAAAPRVDALAALVTGTALWLLAVWVLIAVSAGGLARLPGAAGRLGAVAVRLCVPRVLRGVVIGSVAGGLLLGPAVAASATPVWPTSPVAASTAAPPTGAVPGSPTTPGPAWPTSSAPTATPPAGAPSTPPTPTTPPSVPTLPTTPPAVPTTPPLVPTDPDPATGVVVAPGDSLWSITADALRASGTAPTAARIAAAWPSWYAVNRAEIGPDPGLLHPGTALTAPSTTTPTAPTAR